MDFQQTVVAHLTAVTGRDLDIFAATLDTHVTVILPNGTLIEGRDAVIEFHSAWFADPDWQMRVTPMRSLETAELGFVTLLVDYRDLDPAGAPYAKRYYLNMAFIKKGETWLLTHDQNTFALDE